MQASGGRLLVQAGAPQSRAGTRQVLCPRHHRTLRGQRQGRQPVGPTRSPGPHAGLWFCAREPVGSCDGTRTEASCPTPTRAGPVLWRLPDAVPIRCLDHVAMNIQLLFKHNSVFLTSHQYPFYDCQKAMSLAENLP